MSTHRYAPRALAGDWLRAAGGLAVTGGPVLLLPTAPAVTAILSVLAVIFGFFGLRTAARQFTVIELSEDGIAARGISGNRIAWREVRGLRLDYYSTRRDSRGGWMQLRVSGPAGHIRIESTVDGFAALAASCRAAAAAHGVPVSDTSESNFRTLLGAMAPATVAESHPEAGR